MSRPNLTVNQWIREVLVQEGLTVNKRREKILFGPKELLNFSRCFWTIEGNVPIYPRYKVQVAFLMSVYCWTGARIGALFPDSTDKPDAGLRYRVSVLLPAGPRFRTDSLE